MGRLESESATKGQAEAGGDISGAAHVVTRPTLRARRPSWRNRQGTSVGDTRRLELLREAFRFSFLLSCLGLWRLKTAAGSGGDCLRGPVNAFPLRPPEIRTEVSFCFSLDPASTLCAASSRHHWPRLKRIFPWGLASLFSLWGPRVPGPDCCVSHAGSFRARRRKIPIASTTGSVLTSLCTSAITW